LQAIIFDLDGVITDTAKYHFKAWQNIANLLGVSFSLEDNEQLKGVSRADSLAFILAKGDISLTQIEKDELMLAKNEEYLGYIEEMSKGNILPGITTLLTAAHSAGIKIALGSASKNAPSILDQLELGHYFLAVVDGNNVVNGKPHPEVFLKGAELLQVQPQQTVVIEDAKAGVEAAKKGGFYAIGVGDENVLEQADWIVKSTKELTLSSILNKFNAQ